MKFKKILFHTRFRELAFNSLKAMVELKGAGLKEIVLTHIIPREDVSFVPYGGYLKEDLERMKEEVRIKFEDWQKYLEDQGIATTIRIDSGAANAKILSISEAEKVDMIVVGRKKRSAFEKVYVGSHILDILRRSEIPVLMSKYMVEFEWEGESLTKTNDHIFKRPLLATDWSEPSEKALQAVVDFKGIAEKIIITHNIGRRISKGMDKKAIQGLEAESKKRLAAFCRVVEDAGIEAEYHLAFGKTEEEIIRMSRDYSASMIVMGKTGKDWFHQYCLGGVSHRVAELSELPVLLIS